MKAQCRYLTGTNEIPLTAARARELIGKTVTYLRKCDIDYSGRGYYFPRTSLVIGQFKRNLELEYSHNFVSFDNLVELVVKEAHHEQ